MAKRVVHALEMVEVEAEHRELSAVADGGNRGLQMLLEQGPVGQAGQGIVAGHEGNLLFVPPLLGDILKREHRTAVGHRLACNPHEEAGRNRHLDLHRASRGQRRFGLGADLVGSLVAAKTAMHDGLDRLAYRHSRLDAPRGHAADREEAPVDQLHPMVRAQHHHALQHAVQRGVEQQVGAAQGRLALPPGDGVGAEDFNCARHRADLVAPFGVRHDKSRVTAGQPFHHSRQFECRTGDAAPHHGPIPAGQAPRCRGQSQAAGAGPPGCR